MEETAPLLAMDARVGCIKIEDDLLWSLLVRLDEEVEQELVDLLVVEQDLAVAVVLREARRSLFGPAKRCR